jgi:hypothetical protein
MKVAGVDGATSAQIPQMLLWRDIAADDFDASVKPSPRPGAA